MWSSDLRRVAGAVLVSSLAAMLACGGSSAPPPVQQGPPPAITGVVPASGAAAGSTNIAIAGSGFVAGSGLSVTLGGAAATVVSAAGDAILVKTAAHAPGVVDVVVANPDGQRATMAGAFTYVVGPAISAVTPAHGPAAGSTTVTIAGTGFAAGATVTFGSTEASSVAVSGATEITATAPPHVAGLADVIVRNPDGQTATLAGAYTFDAPASGTAITITGVSPSTGPIGGATAVTITGTNLTDPVNVSFGGGTPVLGHPNNIGTSVTVSSPAHAAGRVDVSVVDQFGQVATAPAAFTFTAAPPSITTLNVFGAPPAGHTPVLILGQNFSASSRVTFGGAEALSVVFSSQPTQQTLFVTTPPQPAGAGEFVPVVVTNPDGQSATATLALGGFHYGPPPAPTDFFVDGNPASKTLNNGKAGQLIDIVGSDFSIAAGRTVQVLFEGQHQGFGTIDARSSATTLVIGIPTLDPGTYQINVTNFDGQNKLAPGTLTILGP
jgi:large repetitive protein